MNILDHTLYSRTALSPGPVWLVSIWRAVNLSSVMAKGLWTNAWNQKGIDVSPHCPRCKSAYESVEHLLSRCKLSKEVWLSFPFAFSVSSSRDSLSFRDWWTSISQNCLNWQLTICWFIWKGRNKTHFEAQVFCQRFGEGFFSVLKWRKLWNWNVNPFGPFPKHTSCSVASAFSKCG